MRKIPRPKCLYCGAECKRHTTKYCSYACRTKHFSELGLHFGGPARKYPDRKCEWCNKPFRPIRARSRFCSLRCAKKSHWENGDTKWRELGPKKGDHPSPETRARMSEAASSRKAHSCYSNCKGGFRADLGHAVRSSWEANLCRLLNWIGVKYQYEGKTLLLKREAGSIHHRPDLLVGNETLIEIKGWWDPRSLEIRKLIEEQYPELGIIYVEEELYRKIEERFASKVPGWELGGVRDHSSAISILNAMEPKIEYSRRQLAKLTGLPPRIVSSAIQTLRFASIITRDPSRRGSWKIIEREEVPHGDAK